MGFFDSLMANQGGSGIYGDSGPRNLSNDIGTALSIRKKVQDEDYNDEIRRRQAASDLQVRQNRMNSIYGTNPMSPGMGQPGGPTGMVTGLNNPQMQTVFKDDPGRITDFQKAGLDLKKEDLANDRQKNAIVAKLGDERLKQGTAKHDLDVEKNQNIFDTKQADMQRKHDEAQSKLELAQKALEQRGNDSKALADYHKAQMEAAASKHQLDLHQKDTALEEQKRLHDAQIQAMQDRLDQAGNTEQETEVNPEQTKKNVKTKKGTKKPGDSLNIR